MSPSMRRLHSPTAQSLGRRTHSFHFDSRGRGSTDIRSNPTSTRAPTPNRAFVSALLSEELKSYGQQDALHKSESVQELVDTNCGSSSMLGPDSSNSECSSRGYNNTSQRHLDENGQSSSLSSDILDSIDEAEFGRPSFELMVQLSPIDPI